MGEDRGASEWTDNAGRGQAVPLLKSADCCIGLWTEDAVFGERRVFRFSPQIQAPLDRDYVLPLGA
jgi:hypothetical protein